MEDTTAPVLQRMEMIQFSRRGKLRMSFASFKSTKQLDGGGFAPELIKVGPEKQFTCLHRLIVDCQDLSVPPWSHHACQMSNSCIRIGWL